LGFRDVFLYGCGLVALPRSGGAEVLKRIDSEANCLLSGARPGMKNPRGGERLGFGGGKKKKNLGGLLFGAGGLVALDQVVSVLFSDFYWVFRA